MRGLIETHLKTWKLYFGGTEQKLTTKSMCTELVEYAAQILDEYIEIKNGGRNKSTGLQTHTKQDQ